MAEDTKYNNLASSIYNSSAGYIPGTPKPPSGARWFGVTKQFIEANFGNGIHGSPTGKYEKSYLSNNYAESVVAGMKTLVEWDGTTAAVKVYSDVEPIFECVSYGLGELRENYGLPYIASEGPYYESPLIAPSVNPTTVAAKRALVNGIMSMFANEQFYLYMLQKGYIYEDIKPLDDELPKFFIEKIKELVDTNFDIPSRYVEQVEYHIDTTTTVIDTETGLEADIPDSETVIRDIIHPDDNPSYGTEYDPSSTLAKENQPSAAGFFVAGTSGGYLEQDELFKPQDQNNQKPTFIESWSATFSKDEPVEATDKQTGDLYPATAPVYEGNIKINADKLITTLIDANILQLNALEAVEQLLGFLKPTPKFNAGTGTTSVVIPGVVIPGASNDSQTEQPLDASLKKAINDQEIAKKLADSLATEEDTFKIGTIHPGATHYINDLAKKEIQDGAVENKALFASFVQDGNVKIQRYPVYNDNPETTALSLEYGSTIKVIEEHIDRSKGLYHKVEMVDPSSKYYETKAPLYIRAELLTKLQGQLPSAPTLFKDYDPAKKPINWSKFDDETIFFDNYYKAYSVVVEPIDPATGEKITSLAEDKCSLKVEDLEGAAIRQGIEVLMRCYDKRALAKEVPESSLSSTLDYLTTGVFQFAYSKPSHGTQPNWYLGTRPNSRLRMIVRIPAKYFDAMQVNPLSLTVAPMTISLLTCNLLQKIKKATTVMRVFQQDLQKWNGTIDYLDLGQEIKRLQAFPFVIQKFIEENGYTFDLEAEDEIEIGISPSDYSVLYVLYTSAGMPRRMVRCFNRFVMQDPIKYSRTMAYLSYLDEIIELGKRASFNNGGWQTLATEYTFPTPTIKPISVAAVGEAINKKNAINMADKLDLDDTLTLSRKKMQDVEIGDGELKLKLAENRSKQKDFVGDAFAAALPQIIDIVCNLPRNEKGLGEMFNLVFDKIDIPNLASLGANSLMKSMSVPDIDLSIAIASLDSPDFGELNLDKFSVCMPPALSEKVGLAESFLNGDTGIEDLVDFSDEVKDELLAYVDNVKLAPSTNDKPEQKPVNAVKYTTMPVEDAECLAEKEPQKYPSNKNTLSKKSSQKLDLIKMIASGEELVNCCKDSNPDIFQSVQDKAKSFLDDVKDSKMPSLDGFGNSNLGFDVGSLNGDFDLEIPDVNIPAVKMPKPPTLPDFSSFLQNIDDTMKGVMEDLNDGLNQTWADIIIDISCELLQVVFDEIFSTSSDIGVTGTDALPIVHGSEDISNLITNFDNAVGMFKSFGVPDEVLAQNSPKQILSQVSEVITPLEVIDLLEGNPRAETVKVVEAKMKEIDPRLLRGVDNNITVEGLFKNLGKMANTSVLENIRIISTRILPNVSGLLCEDEQAGKAGESRNDQAKREVLEKKLDEDCVDTQMREERKLSRERLAELLSYANGADVLDGKIPNPIDNCGSTAKANSNSLSLPTSGLINKNHPTIDYLNDKVIKAVFDPIKMNFSAEANSVVDVYSESDFRYPTQNEDNYSVLKQKLGMNGLSADDIISGIAGSLGDNQPKFEDIAAPLRRLDTEIAPKIKKQLETKTTFLVDQQVENETNKQFKFATIAEEITATEQQKKLGSLGAELSNLRSQFSDLEKKILNVETNPSLPFAINLPDFITEKNTVKDQIFLLEDELKTVAASTSPDDLKTGKTVEKEFPFYHYSRAYPNEAAQLPLADNWVFTFENGTAKGILDNLIRGSEDSAKATLLGRKEIPQEISELSSGYTFYPFITERDQIFANYMKQQWEQVDNSFIVDFDKNIGTNFFTFFTKKRPLYFKSLINMIGAQVSTSDLFNPEGLASLELGEEIQFTQNKCDNLLALENLKEEAKKQYNNTCDDNDSSSAPGAIEESNLVNLMRAAIRVSIIQVTSEAIFLFSKFGFEKTVQDPAAAQFMLSYVVSDLENQDKEFYDEFINQAEILFEKRKENGEKLVDPFGDSDEVDPLVEAPDDEQGRINYLQYMVKEEIKKLAPLIDKKIMTSSIDIDDLFLDTIVPNVNVVRHKDENRFEALIESGVAGNQVSGPKERFRFLKPSDPLFESSGGFVLERYIRVEDSDISEDVNNLNESEKAFSKAWFHRPGGKYNESADATYLESIKLNNDLTSELDFSHTSGVVSIDALLQVMNKISQENNIDVSLVDFSKFVKNFQYGLRLVYIPPTNKDSFKITETNSLSTTVLDLTGLNFEDAQNIVYENLIITNDEIDQAKNDQEDNILSLLLGASSFDSVLENSITTPNGPEAKQAALLREARKEKAYLLTETLGVLESSEEFDASGVALSVIAGDPLTTGTETVGTLTGQTTKLYPVPVVTIEKDLGILDAIKNDEGVVTLGRLISSLNSQVITDTAYSTLKSEMKKSKEYKFLFGYDMPLKRIATSLMIYNVVASVKNYPEIKKAYNETKNLIRSNFFNMLPGDPWWSKQDKRIEEAGGNAGLMADANNSMTATGPSNSDMAAKIAAKASIIILKAVARKLDPNYQLMSVLDNFGLTLDGMTWGSVPVLYPVNFPLPFPPFMGWGPPMNPLGMIAYSLPLLPGEIKKKKERKKEQGEEIQDSSCEDNKSE
jgi:hypothetical protein